MRLIDADKLLSDYSYLFMDIYGKECARMFVGIVNQAQTIELEEIKVEIQNTILEQTYEKGQIDALKKIKAEFLDKCKNYYRFDNEIILNGFIELMDEYIAKMEGENKWEI